MTRRHNCGLNPVDVSVELCRDIPTTIIGLVIPGINGVSSPQYSEMYGICCNDSNHVLNISDIS